MACRYPPAPVPIRTDPSVVMRSGCVASRASARARSLPGRTDRRSLPNECCETRAGTDPGMTSTSTARPSEGLPPIPETMGFGPLRITFDERVLRPRTWTAAQSEWAAEILDEAPAGPVLELCAGAGQIGLLAVLGLGPAAGVRRPEPGRLRVGAAQRGGRPGSRTGSRCARGRWTRCCATSERFAVVVADPPWVRRDEVGSLPRGPGARDRRRASTAWTSPGPVRRPRP